MNQKDKIVELLTHMLNQQHEVKCAEARLEAVKRCRSEAENDFVRGLKAVYGQRAKDGVIYKGQRYFVVEQDNPHTFTLGIIDMPAEVLG